jgi:hypothetical protein
MSLPLHTCDFQHWWFVLYAHAEGAALLSRDPDLREVDILGVHEYL